MKIVFFGTPEYVVPILNTIHKTFVTGPGKSPIVAVVTQPPKPTGRKQYPTYSAVDRWAHERNIDTRYELKTELPEAELGIVAAYGGLIPQNVIDHFPMGLLVVHPSLLPLFRWGSPVPAAIVTNSNPTGITIMKMDEKFDHGPIVSKTKEEILDNDTAETLKVRLFEKSADILVDLIEPYLGGKIKLKPQDHDKATFAREIKRDDAFINPKFIEYAMRGETNSEPWEVPFILNYTQAASPENIERFVRAMLPWPAAWTKIKLHRDKETELKRLKILKARVENEKLILDEVQLEGKNPSPWRQFILAYKSAFNASKMF